MRVVGKKLVIRKMKLSPERLVINRLLISCLSERNSKQLRTYCYVQHKREAETWVWAGTPEYSARLSAQIYPM